MKKLIVLSFCLCLFLTGCFGGKKAEEKKEEKKIIVSKMSYDELEKIINNYNLYENVEVIDVRDSDSYEEGYIMGSLNIPYDELDGIMVSKDKKIVVYSDTGSKSKQAAKDLKKMGYDDVYYISGINDWPYDLVEY